MGSKVVKRPILYTQKKLFYYNYFKALIFLRALPAAAVRELYRAMPDAGLLSILVTKTRARAGGEQNIDV